MKERADWNEANYESTQSVIVDCEVQPREDGAKLLADIMLFCKNPQTYCAQKCILPPSVPPGKSMLVSEEEDNLVKTVFQDARTEDFETPDPITGLAALHYAAYFGIICLVIYLGTISALTVIADKGVNLDLPTKKGTRALHLAVLNEQVSAVQLLLERGANAAATNNELDTPLHLACVRHNAQIIQLLLQHCTRSKSGCYSQIESADRYAGDTILREVNSQGYTPLAIAVLNNQTEIVKTLISATCEETAGAGFVDPKTGNTLLHLAAEKGYGVMVKVLLEECRRQININSRNKDNKTAYDLAHEHFRADCCIAIEYEKKAQRVQLGKGEEEEDSGSENEEAILAGKSAKGVETAYSHIISIPSGPDR